MVAATLPPVPFFLDVAVMNPPGLHSPGVELRVLGPVELHAPEGSDALDLKAHTKSLALLAYVTVEGNGGGVSRDRLSSLFWPEADTEHARGALRQSLRSLRAHLGADALISEGREYLRVSPALLRCDAHEFDDLLDSGHHARGLELFRGEFMDGFHLGGAHAFEDWLDVQRDRYRSHASRAAWSLAERAESAGETARAAYWAKWALGLAPNNELEVRRLMATLDRIGDRGGAIRAYRGLEAWLESELGLPPSPETQRLLEDIRGRTEEAPPVVAPRRQVQDRRMRSDRRKGNGVPVGEDRRRGVPRRRNPNRRSGRDRRAELDQG